MTKYILYAMLLLALIIGGVAIYVGLTGGGDGSTSQIGESCDPTATTDFGGEGCGGGGCGAGERHQIICECSEATNGACTAGYVLRGYCLPDNTCGDDATDGDGVVADQGDDTVDGGQDLGDQQTDTDDFDSTGEDDDAMETTIYFQCNDNGQCVAGNSGNYTNRDDCQAACEPAEVAYSCDTTVGQCVESVDGFYADIDSCRDECAATGVDNSNTAADNSDNGSSAGGVGDKTDGVTELPETAIISDEIDRAILFVVSMSMAYFAYRYRWGADFFELRLANYRKHRGVSLSEYEQQLQQRD